MLHKFDLALLMVVFPNSESYALLNMLEERPGFARPSVRSYCCLQVCVGMHMVRPGLSVSVRFWYKMWQGLAQGVTKSGTRCGKVWYKV